MRIEVKSIKDAEKLSSLFEESHIERSDGRVCVVIDKTKRKLAYA